MRDPAPRQPRPEFPRANCTLHIVGVGCDEARASSSASTYPIASSDLPGSSPTRPRPESSTEWPASSAALLARAQRVRSAFADRNRRLPQCLASLDGRRRIPSGPGRVQHERCPPQSRQWVRVGSGNTSPRLFTGLPVGGRPVFPGRRRHRLRRGQQLPQQRCFTVRRRPTLAGPATRQRPLAVPSAPPGPIAPGRGFALSAVQECWQCSSTSSALRIAFKSGDIFASPYDRRQHQPPRHRLRDCPPGDRGCSALHGVTSFSAPTTISAPITIFARRNTSPPPSAPARSAPPAAARLSDSSAETAVAAPPLEQASRCATIAPAGRLSPLNRMGERTADLPPWRTRWRSDGNPS